MRFNPSRNAYEKRHVFPRAVHGSEKSGNREGKPYYMVDAGITVQQAMLAATQLGLGTCWIGAFPEAPVKALLGVPYNWRVVALATGRAGRDGAGTAAEADWRHCL